jgi:hypothetical protein
MPKRISRKNPNCAKAKPGAKSGRQIQHWLLLVCLWCIGSAATARELNLGVISMRPEYHQPRLEALAKVIAPKLGAQGITGFHIVMARDAAHMSSLLAAGKVDWLTSTLAKP